MAKGTYNYNFGEAFTPAFSKGEDDVKKADREALAKSVKAGLRKQYKGDESSPLTQKGAGLTKLIEAFNKQAEADKQNKDDEAGE